MFGLVEKFNQKSNQTVSLASFNKKVCKIENIMPNNLIQWFQRLNAFAFDEYCEIVIILN